jgi:hypothetical protein
MEERGGAGVGYVRGGGRWGVGEWWRVEGVEGQAGGMHLSR